jgi:hypothetical protein
MPDTAKHFINVNVGSRVGHHCAAKACAGVRPFMPRPLVGAALIVAFKVSVENGLHLLDGLQLGAPPLDPKVLVEQRAVLALDDAVRLRGV